MPLNNSQFMELYRQRDVEASWKLTFSHQTTNAEHVSFPVPVYMLVTVSFALLHPFSSHGVHNFGLLYQVISGFPGGSDGKESPCNAGDLGSIPGSGRSSGEGNGNLLLYSCLESSMDGGAW